MLNLESQFKFAQEQLRELADGDHVFQEGDDSREMYVVVEGEVVVSKLAAMGEITLATLRKGDFVGEMSLLESLPRSATARAKGKTKLLVIHPGGFLLKIRRDPTFAFEMLQSLSRRIRVTNDNLMKELNRVGNTTDSLKAICKAPSSRKKTRPRARPCPPSRRVPAPRRRPRKRQNDHGDSRPEARRHFGSALGKSVLAGEKSDRRIFHWAARNGYDVVINGDGFEIAQVSFSKIARDVPEVFHALKSFTARGRNVYYVIGNHDIVLENFLNDWGGFKMAPFLNVWTGQKRVRIEHGHLYDPFFVRNPELYEFLTWLAGLCA